MIAEYLDTFQIPVRLILPRSNKWDNLRAKAIKQDFDVARDDILLLKSTYRQLFPKHTRHSKFVGLCGGGGNTGPARSRASGQTATQTATIVSESPILAWYQARIGDSDTIVTGLPTLDTIVAHICQIVNRLDTIVTHNCNDAVWVGHNRRPTATLHSIRVLLLLLAR